MYPRSLISSNGEPMGITLIIVDSVFLGLATVAVGIRMWSRKIQRHNLLLNDYAAVVAWIFTASLVITSDIVTFHYGVGNSTGSVNLTNVTNILKAYIASDALWAVATTSIKISIVHFYISIFRSNRAFRTVAYAIITLVLAFGIAVVISDFLTCRPLSKAWNPLQSGVCESPIDSLIALSSCNMAIDLIIILLPMPMIWRLQMATRRKIEISIIFALGFLVCIVTMIRLVFSTQLRLSDYTYDISRISIVTELEPLLGIIVACLPLFPPALKKILDAARKTKSETPVVLSSTMARLRLQRSTTSAFRSLDDSFPLTDLEDKRAQNHITGPNGKLDNLSEGFGVLNRVRIPPQSSIMIEQDWEVRSDEARHLDEKM